MTWPQRSGALYVCEVTATRCGLEPLASRLAYDSVAVTPRRGACHRTHRAADDDLGFVWVENIAPVASTITTVAGVAPLQLSGSCPVA
jgi:hypothetical protein